MTTAPDPTKIYLNPVEKDPIRQNSAVRQLIENAGNIAGALVVDASGNVVTGASSAQNGLFGLDNLLEVHESSISPVTSDGVGFYRWTANDNGFNVYFLKSKGAIVGTQTAVSSGAPTALGTINFAGSDGTAFSRGAFIASHVDGPVAASQVPGCLNFYTRSISAENEWVRIDSNGNVMMTTVALSTAATDGFFYIATCPGAPQGTPTASPGGAVPMLYDTTNNKLWVYNTKWRSVTLSTT